MSMRTTRCVSEISRRRAGLLTHGVQVLIAGFGRKGKAKGYVPFPHSRFPLCLSSPFLVLTACAEIFPVCDSRSSRCRVSDFSPSGSTSSLALFLDRADALVQGEEGEAPIIECSCSSFLALCVENGVSFASPTLVESAGQRMACWDSYRVVAGLRSGSESRSAL